MVVSFSLMTNWTGIEIFGYHRDEGKIVENLWWETIKSCAMCFVLWLFFLQIHTHRVHKQIFWEILLMQKCSKINRKQTPEKTSAVACCYDGLQHSEANL